MTLPQNVKDAVDTIWSATYAGSYERTAHNTIRAHLGMHVRVLEEVNTDPQRRCYNGGHAKSEFLWTEWKFLYIVANEEEGLKSIKTFSRINKSREYKLIWVN